MGKFKIVKQLQKFSIVSGLHLIQKNLFLAKGRAFCVQ